MSVQNWISANPKKFIAGIVAILAGLMILGAVLEICVTMLQGKIMVESFKDSMSGVSPAERVNFTPPPR